MKLLTVKEVASRWAVQPGKVYQLAKQGVLPVIRLGPGGTGPLRFTEEDVQAFQEACRTAPAGPTRGVTRQPEVTHCLKHLKL